MSATMVGGGVGKYIVHHRLNTETDEGKMNDRNELSICEVLLVLMLCCRGFNGTSIIEHTYILGTRNI